MDPYVARSDLLGLTRKEAADRLRAEGPNELGASERRGLWMVVLGLVREPMTLLLLICGALYLVLGDAVESAILLSFVVFILGITLLQDRKAERALEALRDLASPRALVIRDGERRRIAGCEVVRDDLVVLAEGDRVPAVATILAAQHLAVDESLVTGESASVR
jgi:P-type Ca2+ transporter type 2C